MKSLESLFPPHVAEAVGTTLMHSLWQLAALALLLIVVLALVPQAAARLRYWLAVGTLSLMLVLPLATFGLLYSPPSATTFATTETAMSGATSLALPAQPNKVFYASYAAPLPVETKGMGVLEQVTAFVEQNAYLFFGIWLAGMLLFTARFLGGCWQVQRLRNRQTQAVPEALQDRFTDLLRRMGIQRSIGLKFSSMINTPMVIGAFKPVVLLPASLLSGLSIEQVECILIHELAHVRRWDYLVNMVQSIVEIVLFFHPATWWVTRVIRQERENCCDEMVVRLHSNKVQYARALLNLEMMRQQTPTLALASQGGDLNSRIRRITGGVVPPRKGNHTRGLLFGFLTVAVVLLLASQTPTVVKAAMPFFTEETAEDQDADENDVEDQDARNRTRTTGATVTPNGASMQAALRLSGLLGNVQFTAAGLDSPITKVIIKDDNEEISMTFGPGGKVTSATKNGVAVPENELQAYQERANEFFNGPAAVPPVAPLPPIPPFGPTGPMTPMPPMPAIGPIPPVPPIPYMGNVGGKDWDSKRFEAEMEEFGKAMEAWGKDFGKQFDTKEWAEFGKNTGEWAQSLVGIGMGPETEEMKKVQADIERLNEEMKNTKDKEKLAEMAEQQAELSQRLGDLHGEAIDRNMGEFEQRMEEWSQRFSSQMERLAELESLKGEAFARDMETLAERASADAEQAQEEADRAAEEADEAAREADEAAEEAERAEEDAQEAAEEAERAADAAEAVGQQLVEDGLISSKRSYKLKINNKELIVNGKTATGAQHKKYERLLEKELGIDVDKEWVTIQHNSK